MSEMEVPLEQTQEDMHHHAHHATEPWVAGVALTSALVAVIAAITVLVASSYADQSMEKLLEKNDQYSYYQAKSIKSNILKSKLATLEEQHDIIKLLAPNDAGLKAEIGKKEVQWKATAEKDEAKLVEYEKEMEKTKEEAVTADKESKHFNDKHSVMARGVTMFQVAIAVAAIAVLTKQKSFWFVGLLFALVGVVFAAKGMFLT